MCAFLSKEEIKTSVSVKQAAKETNEMFQEEITEKNNLSKLHDSRT